MASRQCRSQIDRSMLSYGVHSNNPILVRCTRRHGHSGLHWHGKPAYPGWINYIRWTDESSYLGPQAPKPRKRGKYKKPKVTVAKGKSEAARKVFG